MISPEHEEARAGAGANFIDTVSLEFSDPERGLFGLAWMTRLPNSDRTRARAFLFASGELEEQLELERDTPIEDWRDARLDGVRMTTEAPLERWWLEASGSKASLQLEATAVSVPRELSGQMPAQAIGLEQYEQVCELRGEVSAAGAPHTVHCLGRRVHSWGEPAWDSVKRWRTLYAVSEAGRAISVAAALPAASAGHGDELRYARQLDDNDAPPFEDVRLSTVYDSEGSPKKAGLELWMPGDEMPRRLGGAAICGTRIRSGEHMISLSFFRWSMEGVPAYGSYEVVERQ